MDISLGNVGYRALHSVLLSLIFCGARISVRIDAVSKQARLGMREGNLRKLELES